MARSGYTEIIEIGNSHVRWFVCRRTKCSKTDLKIFFLRFGFVFYWINDKNVDLKSISKIKKN